MKTYEFIIFISDIFISLQDLFYIIIIMYLMYYLNEDGKRVYTLKVRKLYISKHRSLCEYETQKLGFVSSFFLSLLEHTAE